MFGDISVSLALFVSAAHQYVQVRGQPGLYVLPMVKEVVFVGQVD